MSDNKNLKIPAVIIFVFGLVLYSNTLKFDYAVDDAIVITENRFTQKGISGIKDILTHDTFEGFSTHKNFPVAGGRYRPFSLITFAAEINLFGEQPLISHFINAVLFSLCGVIIYFLLINFFPIQPNIFFSIPFCTAIIFLAHPIHTEAVANIKGRDEILAFAGSIAGLLFLSRFYDSGKIFQLVSGILFFFCGMLSKENAITFLAIIPMAILFFRPFNMRRFVFSLTGLVIASSIFLFLRQTYANPVSIGEATNLLNNPFAHASVSEKYATITFTLLKYLQLLFFPFQLTHDYYYNHIPLVGWSDIFVLLSILIHAILFIAVIKNFRKKSAAAFSILFYFITLLPVSNLLFPVGTNMSERFLFMPSFGFCIMIATVFLRANIFFEKQKTYRFAYLSCLTLLLIFYSLKTVSRNLAWKNNLSLFSADISVSSRSAKANFDLGAELAKTAVTETDSFRKNDLFNQAEQSLNKAISILPTYAHAYQVTGNIHANRKNYSKAIRYYEKALEFYPGWLDAYYNLASVYQLEKNYRKQIEYLQKAVQADQKNAMAYYRIGISYGRYLNEPDSAIQYLELSVSLNPDYADAFQDLGIVYAMKNDYSHSVKAFQQAIQLNPKNVQLYQNLSLVYLQMGDAMKAKEVLSNVGN